MVFLLFVYIKIQNLQEISSDKDIAQMMGPSSCCTWSKADQNGVETGVHCQQMISRSEKRNKVQSKQPVVDKRSELVAKANQRDSPKECPLDTSTS